MTAVLSDLLNSFRVRHSDWAVIELGAPGGLQFRAHDRAYVHFVLDGEILVDSPPALASTAVLTAGDCVIVLGGQSHTIRDMRNAPLTEVTYFCDAHTLDAPPVLRFGGSNRDSKILSGTLDIQRASGEPFARGLPNILICRRGNETGDTTCDLRLDPSWIERGASGPGSMAFLGAVGDMLLVQAVRATVVGLAPSGKAAAEIFGAPQIGKSLLLIDLRPEKNWSVSALAAEVGMSRSVFAAAFRQAVGEPPMQYISSVRITRAGRLLKSSTLSVAKIAQRVGYGSVSSFARAFKKELGQTPAVFRRCARRNVQQPQPVALQLDSFLS